MTSINELARLQQIDQVCDEFETDWQSGREPKIEEYLVGFEDPIRSLIFRELLLVEWQFLNRSGTLPNLEEYQQRHQLDKQLVAEAHAQFRQSALVHSEDTGPWHAAIDTMVEEDAPQTIGGYRVLEKIGEGGMGTVYRAHDEQLHRDVAIKVIRPELSASREARERFLREARSAASIHHDHVITVFHVGEFDKQLFLVTELLEGESLGSRIKRNGKLAEPETLQIGIQIAAGLEAAHQRDVCHRDIKPENVWLEAGNDRVKILDFGLAKAIEGEIDLTNSGSAVGTPRYMSPEQAQGETADHRSDLFSLGAILYHLSTGKAPFDGKNVTATLMAVAHEKAAPVRELAADISPALAEVITTLLNKDPEQRYQSANELLTVMQRIMLNSQGESSVNKSQTVVEGESRRSRRPAWIWGTCLSMLVLAAVLVYFNPRKPPPVAKSESKKNDLDPKSDDSVTPKRDPDVPVKDPPKVVLAPTMPKLSFDDQLIRQYLFDEGTGDQTKDGSHRQVGWLGNVGKDSGWSDDLSPTMHANAYSMRFDGKNYIDIGELNKEWKLSNGGTFAAWIKIKKETSENATNVTREDSGTPSDQPHSTPSRKSSGQLRNPIRDSWWKNLQKVARLPATLLDGKWHHLVVSWGILPSSVRVFIDGHEHSDLGDRNSGQRRPRRSVPFFLSAEGDGKRLLLHVPGWMDDVRFYRIRLNAKQIAEFRKLDKRDPQDQLPRGASLDAKPDRSSFVPLVDHLIKKYLSGSSNESQPDRRQVDGVGLKELSERRDGSRIQ